ARRNRESAPRVRRAARRQPHGPGQHPRAPRAFLRRGSTARNAHCQRSISRGDRDTLPTRMIRVFIADDQGPARERLKELLEDLADDVPTVLAGEAANGVEALERLPASGAQVLLLDI